MSDLVGIPEDRLSRDEAHFFRFVTIDIPGRTEYLTLCEVEIYGSIGGIYTSQNLIRATQCKFPLQNIHFSCKT